MYFISLELMCCALVAINTLTFFIMRNINKEDSYKKFDESADEIDTQTKN